MKVKILIILLGIHILLLILLVAKRYTDNARAGRYISTIEDNRKWKNNYLFDEQTSSLVFKEEQTTTKIINLTEQTRFLRIPECRGYNNYLAPGRYLVLNCNKVISLVDMKVHLLNRTIIDYEHRMDSSLRADLLNTFRKFSERGELVYIYNSGYFTAYMFIEDDAFTLFEIYDKKGDSMPVKVGEQMLSIDTFSRNYGITEIPKNQTLNFSGKNGDLLTVKNSTKCFMGACSTRNKVTLFLNNKQVNLSLRELDLPVLLGIVQAPEEDRLYFLGSKEIKAFRFNTD